MSRWIYGGCATMEQIIIEAIDNVGVPALIAFYVLFRVNTSIEALTQAVYELRLTIMEGRNNDK